MTDDVEKILKAKKAELELKKTLAKASLLMEIPNQYFNRKLTNLIDFNFEDDSFKNALDIANNNVVSNSKGKTTKSIVTTLEQQKSDDNFTAGVNSIR